MENVDSVSRRDSVIRVVRGLLSLGDSNNNDNENEAMLSMEKASYLMAKYNLTMDDLYTDKDEQRIEDRIVETGGSRAQWTRTIWNATSQLNFCKYYSSKNRVIALTHVLIGTQGNVESTKIMAQYLTETVENMARTANIRGAQKSAYRLGAASRLYWRIMALKEERAKGVQVTNNPYNLPALANLYRVHETANDAFYTEKYKVRLRKGTRATAKDIKAYSLGYTDADNIPLNTQIE